MSLKSNFVNYLNLCFEGGFIIDDQNREPMRQIFNIFENEKYGVTIAGNTGSGKSLVFTVLNRIIHPKSELKFTIEQAQDIVHDYNNLGDEILAYFERKQIFVIDDIGIEKLGKHYGKDCNVIADIINIRYSLWVNFGVKTHFTTNLSGAELKEKYGDRIASRLNEMSKMVILTSDDRRAYRNFKGWVAVTHEKAFTVEDKQWHEMYAQMTEKRRNMTPEQIEAENKAERLQFKFGDNEAFNLFKKQLFHAEN